MVTSAIQQSAEVSPCSSHFFRFRSVCCPICSYICILPVCFQSVIRQLILLIPYFAPVNTNTSLHHPLCLFHHITLSHYLLSVCPVLPLLRLLGFFPVTATFSFFSNNTNKYPRGRLGSARHPQYFFSIYTNLTHNSRHKPDL